MEKPTITFAQLARGIASKHVSSTAVESALNALGSKSLSVMADLTVERRSSLINHFVRSLRDTSVQTSSRLEHALLSAASCRTNGRRVIVLKDAISLIAVRNQVHQLATGIGMSWNESMRLQSAISDLARFLVDKGGGRIEIEDTSSALFFMVDSISDLGPCSPPETPTPPWLTSTMNIAQGFRSARTVTGTHFEFWHARPQSMVA